MLRLVADGDQRPHRRRLLAQVRARDLRQQVDALDAPSACGPRSRARPRVEAGGDVLGLAQEARRPCPASSGGRSDSACATSNDEWCTDGRNSCEKNARTTCRTWSVAITCVIPSRPASWVATVDLPTPVTPPSSTSSGRSRLRTCHHWRNRASTCSLSPPRRTSSATARSSSTPISAGPAGDEPLLDLLRERERALRRQARSPSATAPSAPWNRAARSRCARRPSAGAARSGRSRGASATAAPRACGVDQRSSARRAARRSAPRRAVAQEDDLRARRAARARRRRRSRPPSARSGTRRSRSRTRGLDVALERVAAREVRGEHARRRRPCRASPARSRRSASGRAVTKHATRAPVGQRLRRLGPQLARARSGRGASSARVAGQARAARPAPGRPAPSSTSRSERSSRSGPEVDERLRARCAARGHADGRVRGDGRQRRAAALEHDTPGSSRAARPAGPRARSTSKVSPAGPSPQRRQPTVVTPASTASSR